MAIDKLQELQEAKNAQAVTIKELASRQKDWTDEDRANWKTINAEYDAGVAEMDAQRESLDVAARAAAIDERQERREFDRNTQVKEARVQRQPGATEEHRALAIQAWLRTGLDREITDEHKEACDRVGINPRHREFDMNIRKPSDNIRGRRMWHRQGRPMGLWEKRDLEIAGEPELIPEGFSGELEQTMLHFGGMRQVARVVTTATGNDLPWPTSDDTGNTGVLLAEATTIGSSVDPTIGVKNLNAYKYSSKAVLISQELLEDAAFNMATLIAGMLGERIGRITNTQFTTGTGSAQPKGLFTACSTRVTAASATAFTASELIDLVHSVDIAYRNMASVGFMMNDTSLSELRKLVDGDTQYLWQPGFQLGQPDRIVGHPYTVNNDAPHTATGLDAVAFGAFEKYIIRDCASARFYRLDERYRDTDQTGFIMFSRHDGELLNTSAVKVLTMA